jgi:hypothetical protein
VWSPQK